MPSVDSLGHHTQSSVFKTKPTVQPSQAILKGMHMKSPTRFHTLLNSLLGAATALGALLIIGAQSTHAQQLIVDFRFDTNTGTNPTTFGSTTLTLNANGATQTYTVDIWGTVVPASATAANQLGLQTIALRGVDDGGTAFATGAGIGVVSGSFAELSPFNPAGFSQPANSDLGKTTNNGTSATAGADGFVDFGGTIAAQRLTITSSTGGLQMGGGATGSASATNPAGWQWEMGTFQVTIGGVGSTAGAITKFFPTLLTAGQGATTAGAYSVNGGTSTISGPITVGSPLTFVVGGVAPPGSILNMTPPTVTINSLTNGTNSSTLAVANTNATSPGTYTGAFTGTSAGASQNPTGTVNVPASGSVNEVITYLAPAAVGPVSFGYTITNTSNAADVQGAGANKSTAFTVNVGNATADNSNALPNAANPFTNATRMTGVVAHGSSYQGLESQVTSLSGTGGFNADDGTAAHKGGTAIILAGSNNVANGGGSATVAMQWRTLSTNASFNEQTGLSPTGPSGKIYNLSLLRPTTGLVSDVVNLTGLTPGEESPTAVTDPFVFQMSFNPVLTAKHGTVVNSLAQNKLINLISYNPTTNLWDRAVDDNTGNAITSPLDPSYGYVGSYAQFISAGQPGNGKTLAQTLGAWGVDPINDVVWADVNHNSQFAVVPEPGTILLAGLGLMGLVGLRRRMKASA